MSKIQLKKNIIISGVILIVVALLGIWNGDTSNLKSNTINACSSEEEAVYDKAQELALEQSQLENTNNSELGQEKTYLDGLKSDLDSTMSALNSEKDNWSNMTDDEKSSWYDKKDEYEKNKSTYEDRASAYESEANAYNDAIKKQTEKIGNLQSQLDALKAALEQCQNNTNNTTSGTGTDTTSGTGTDTTSGTGTDTTSGTTGGTTEYCGDGICNNGEDSGTCSSDCPHAGYCGDGVIDSGEQCEGGEHCSECQITPYCGDGNIDSGEQCDSSSDCDSSCNTVIASCGDGTVQGDEECDDGNQSDEDSCSSSCEEQCDGGEDDYGIGSSFFGLQSSWFKKKECIPGCKYKKADNYNPQATQDDKSCLCSNGLDFYSTTKKHIRSCQCDLFYEPKDGVCVKAGCKNGLNVDNYPDCKCPKLRDIVVNGECKTPSWPKSICSGAFNICVGKFAFGAFSIDAGGRLRIPLIR